MNRVVTAYHHFPPAPMVPRPGFRPKIFEGLWCHCGETHDQGARYFASARDDEGRVALLAGPYREHYEALDVLPRARALASDMDPRGPWYFYGTCRMPSTSTAIGKLNDLLAGPDVAPGVKPLGLGRANWGIRKPPEDPRLAGNRILKERARKGQR